jgi:predicted dehydrogenase
VSTAPRLRIGVAGTGRRGREHLETLAALGDRFEVAAVCDVSAPSAEAAAAASGATPYTRLTDFFDKGNLHVVLITTPRETHHLVVRMAADRGLHMLIETPLGQTRRMMDEICEDVYRTGVKVEVAENMWRRPPERLARQALDAGLVGKVIRVSSYYDDAGDNHVYHTMSRMRGYAGADVDEVRAYAREFVGTATGAQGSPGTESWSHALLSFANGVLGSLTFVNTWAGPLRGGHPRFFSIEGTEGFILAGLGSSNMLRRMEEGKPVDYPLRIENRRIGEQDVPWRYSYGTSPELEYVSPYGDRALHHGEVQGRWWDAISRADELDSIYRAVVTNEPPDYDLERARRDVELAIIVAESARLDRPLAGRLESDETGWERERHEAFRRQWGFDPFDHAAFQAWQ